jgi:CubicO group peptidase (beta-lactamase class C family)
MMGAALREEVFPGAVLLVSCEGIVRMHAAYGVANRYTGRLVHRRTLFDLASLTKPLATSLVVMELVRRGQLSLEDTLGKVLGDPCAGSDKAPIQLSQLLTHTAGLPAYRPYFRELVRLSPARRKADLRRRLVHEPLAARPAERTLYSDLGFMLLQWVVETSSGQSLDKLFDELVCRPLGLVDLFFIARSRLALSREFAATELCPWRRRLLQGRVHDENADVLGGIAGHAGLFGAAADVHALLAVLLRAYHGSRQTPFAGDWVRRFLDRRLKAERALGFDRPAAKGSASGRFFSPCSVGHLGFTGTSFWMDLEQAIIVVLLTNRIHPHRSNEKIKTFRPRLHDTVMEALINRRP